MQCLTGDFVVCGAGAAGMAAALSAARCGARVCLLEAGPRIGGTVAGALIHTLGGLYDSRGEFLNGGLPRELAERLIAADASTRPRQMGRTWVLNISPAVYRSVVERWIEAQPRITLVSNARVTGVTRVCDRVHKVRASTPSGPISLPAKAVLDATGTAEVVRLIDPELVLDDERRAAGGLIFRLRGVAPGALAFPRGIGIVRALRSAADEGTLPPDCGKTWIDTGVHADEAYVKLFVPLRNGWRNRDCRKAILHDALEAQAAVVAFLKRRPEFARAELVETGTLGVRDGGRVRGEYVLTAADVREGRTFRDAACRCAWPIEYWDPQHGVSLEYLPHDGYYEIPLRALKVKGLKNVWTAGKSLSADRHAHASARVAGTCWAMGEAAGRAAAKLCQQPPGSSSSRKSIFSRGAATGSSPVRQGGE